MDTIWIVILIVAALAVLAGVFAAMRKRRETELEERRVEARSHREEAEATARHAEQARLEAEEQAERARREQDAAEALRRQADEVDPDVDVEETETADETPRSTR